jgi:CDP-glycerol glycerophosphotransferase
LQADLPLRTDRELRIPAWVYRPHWRDLDPFVQVDSVEWRRGNLVIAGLAYVPSVDVSKRRYTSKIVILRPRRRFRPPVVAVATSSRHPRATALSGQDRYDYTWAGFRAEISSRWFRVAGRWLTGDWDCFILVRGHGVWRPAWLNSPALGGAGRPGFLEPSPGLQVRPAWVGRHLHIGVLRTPARLTGFSRDGDGLAVEADLDLGEVGGAVLENAQFVLVRRGGALTQTFPAGLVSVTGRTARVCGAFPLAGLPAQPERPGPGLEILGKSGPSGVSAPREGGGTEWELYLKPAGGSRVRVTFPEALPEARYPRDTREVAVERGRYGAVVLAEREPRPVISEHTWDPHGVLVLRGRYLGPSGARLDAVLRSRESAEEHVLACQRDDEQFSVKVPVAAMPTFGEALPLRDGPWEVAARVSLGPRQSATPIACDHARLNEISHRKTQVGPKLYAFTTADYDTPVITAEPRLRLSEQSQFNRRVLRRAVYPVYSRRPLWDAVLLVSWNGKQCTDNPLGIAEELRRRGDDREHIWVVNDYCVAVPPGARAVLTGTEEYFEALARCRYVVSNDDMPAEFRKREGQVYLQTWHGTPLKRVGFDIGLPQFASGGAYLDRLAADVAKWDLLLSQNPFSTPILRRAFRFEGEICESGYPRNDLLSRSDERCAQVRAKLGVVPGKRVVLYAPTWRDNQYYASGRYRFDLRLDLDRAWEVLGPDHVVLVRGHHHLANDVSASARPGFVLNVTGYPDVAELFLVTDVLVTDYSSVMFDFAVTGRPMVFFAYDLASYRDHLRGFCFDFEAEAPGPVLTTSEEALAAIRDAESAASRYTDAYQAFAAKYCPYDDGKAAARVCDRLFAT